MATASEQCDTGLRLFSERNETLNIWKSFTSFRMAYQPYHGYICLNICILGVITNIINIVVLTKPRMRSSVNILLTAIAICDTGTMLSYLIYILHFILLATQECDPNTYSYSWMVWLLGHIVWSVGLHTSSLWLSVALAFLRTRTLRQAHMGSKWLRLDKTWKICAGTYFVVFAFCVPNLFGQNVIDITSMFNGTSATCSKVIASGAHFYTIGVPNCLVYRVNLWVNGTTFKTIPCALLAYYSFALLFIIRRAKIRKKALLALKHRPAGNSAFSASATVAQTTLGNAAGRRRSSGVKRIGYLIKNASTVTTGGVLPAGCQPRAQKVDRTTPMLLVILFIFLITELPQGIIAVLSGIYLKDVQQHIYDNFGDILDLLSLVNSSVNFFLYCTMSAKYRQTFWQSILPRNIYRRVRSSSPVIMFSEFDRPTTIQPDGPTSTTERRAFLERRTLLTTITQNDIDQDDAIVKNGNKKLTPVDELCSDNEKTLHDK